MVPSSHPKSDSRVLRPLFLQISGIGGSVPAYTGQDVYFHWVFGAGFITRFLTFLPAEKAVVRFHLNGGFISPNNVVKFSTEVLLCPIEPFSSIFRTNELAVSRAAAGPAEYATAFQGGRQ